MKLTIIKADGDIKLPNGLYARNCRITFDPTAVSLTEGKIDCNVYLQNGEDEQYSSQTLHTMPVSIPVQELPATAQQALVGVLFPALQGAIKALLEAQFTDATFTIE